MTDKQGRNTFYNHENNVSEEQGRSSHVTETSEGWTILKHLKMSHALLRTVMAKKEEQVNDSNPYPAAPHKTCHGWLVMSIIVFHHHYHPTKHLDDGVSLRTFSSASLLNAGKETIPCHLLAVDAVPTGRQGTLCAPTSGILHSPHAIQTRRTREHYILQDWATACRLHPWHA